MGILDIENRVLLRLFGDLLEVEIERRLVLAVEHHETHNIGADLVDHVTQSHELPCPFRHPDRLAAPIELDQLAQPHDDLHIAVARVGGTYGLEALYISGM